MGFVSFVSVVSLVAFVSQCEFVQNTGSVSGTSPIPAMVSYTKSCSAVSFWDLAGASPATTVPLRNQQNLILIMH